MAIKIGINGMGRIGRMVLRSIIENKNKKIIIKHINNRSDPGVTFSLLKYDSIHGKFNANLNFNKKNFFVNKKKFHFHKKPILKILIGKNLESIMFLNVLENLIRRKNYYLI